jgi:alpha-tubulin suppressor-like RCC1 family protein
MSGKDRQLLRATFTPTDLDRFGIAVAFRSLKMQSSPPPNAGSIATHHQLLAAGQNNQGQLGGPPFVNWTLPRDLSGGLDIQTAVAGDGFTLMLTQAGDLWGVGSNAYGQLGDGSTDPASEPVWVAQDVQDIEAGRHHALFLTSNGDLFGMGRNQYGQLGDGTLADQSTPVLIESGVSAMAAGTSFSIFLKEA